MQIPAFGGELPPRERRLPFVPFYSPVGEQGFTAVLTGARLLLARHHWRDGRTCPCYGDDCWCKKEGVEPRFKGYVSCSLKGTGANGILELTEGAVDQLRELAIDVSNLRGRSLHLSRRTKAKSSAVVVQLSTWSPTSPLGAEIDPLPYVLKRWGMRLNFAFLHELERRKLADRPAHQEEGQ